MMLVQLQNNISVEIMATKKRKGITFITYKNAGKSICRNCKTGKTTVRKSRKK